jgi:hypothetical protein
MKSPEDLKDSGFVPYYKFGKLNKEDLKIDPSLSKDKNKYDQMFDQLSKTDTAYMFRDYLQKRNKEVPNYLRKLDPIPPS